MSAFLLPLLRNLGTALLTKTFGIWLAKLAAKSTKTMVDDNAVLLLEGGLNNDAAKIEAAAKAILEELSKKV
ncbi:hypothetical protein HGG82_07930 [Marinomonas sp. M1K-6]|uniref:Uncharacterized protein n=1 Tax=Marinomonas profundi TaxID=2726122 RepID=A0A847R660_9GAMM|nr:hypothetical protein [Marinomonas profundi]NLQ17556.1 hypothetical protein [Marinomonas profundi]UDV02227.1 hypothetical protein J8N69_11550 [Marinomonas profundi]